MKKGFTLVEIVSAIIIFLLSISSLYLIISRNIREQAEVKMMMDGVNFFKIKYYDLPITDEYMDFSIDKETVDELFGKKEYLYRVKHKDTVLISIYAIE